MATMDRLRIAIEGGPGGSGVMTLYSGDWPSHHSDAVAFATALALTMPNDITLTVPDGGEQISDVNGDTVGAWTGGTTTGCVGNDSGSWAAGVGARIRWNTAGIVANRRVVGTTFVVPVGAGNMETNGLWKTAALDDWSDAAEDFQTAMAADLLVWSRPTQSRAGSSHSVLGAFVPNRVTSLASRRS